MKREPRLTKRERRDLNGGPGPSVMPNSRIASQDGDGNTFSPSQQLDPGSHIHCVSCGKHLDTVGEARDRAAKGLGGNLWMNIRCAHGTEWYACMGCLGPAKQLLDEHDRTGNAVRAAGAWH
jgi:hypothetical protein